MDATIAVALDIALEDPAGEISHLIRVEFPWPVTFITRTYINKREISAESIKRGPLNYGIRAKLSKYQE